MSMCRLIGSSLDDVKISCYTFCCSCNWGAYAGANNFHNSPGSVSSPVQRHNDIESKRPQTEIFLNGAHIRGYRFTIYRSNPNCHSKSFTIDRLFTDQLHRVATDRMNGNAMESENDIRLHSTFPTKKKIDRKLNIPATNYTKANEEAMKYDIFIPRTLTTAR